MHEAVDFPWFRRMVVAGRPVLLRWSGEGSWGASGPSRLQRELFLTK